MVEELEHLTKRINNGSARGDNLEVKLSPHLRLSLHLAAYCASVA